jgi:undecaprenyl-diphosphatase
MNTDILYFFFHLTQAHPWLATLAVFFSEYVVYALPIGVVVYIFFTEKNWFKKSMYMTVVVVAAVLLTDYVLKGLFSSIRPFTVLGYTPLIPETGFSFPSGHATLAGAVFGGAYFSISKHPWFTVLVGILAFAIALSRVMLGVHYPVDVLAGLVWGILVSFIS